MDIRLNFINRSNDANNSSIVLFQKNVASGYNELAVAWLVIENCGMGDNHPFTYPMTMQVNASDSYGNFSQTLDAQPGQAFQMTRNGSGDVLSKAGPATYPTEVQVQNNMLRGALNANIYKDGRLLATKTSVAPEQMAAFEFKPSLWIGAVSQVTQGEVMNAAIVEQTNTEISLLGVASADILLTGGGPGKLSTPFSFTLENVRMA